MYFSISIHLDYLSKWWKKIEGYDCCSIVGIIERMDYRFLQHHFYLVSRSTLVLIMDGILVFFSPNDDNSLKVETTFCLFLR